MPTPGAIVPAAARPSRDPASVLAESTFSAGVRLLPGDLRRDAARLYCLLREIDDLVDEEDPHASARVDALERWARGGESETLETKTLVELSQRYPLSRQALIDFCTGMRHDLSGATIATEEDLRRYCHQVAGTVGILLCGLFGTTDPAAAERGLEQIGAAMQLTNILRDIDEDLARGRIYIPRATIARFGFPAPGAREHLLRDQIARADALYEQGWAAISLLQNGRRAMALSTVLYREILRQIEREGYGRRPGRVAVPAWRRDQLIAKHAAR
jgi:phytoene synthase